MKRFWLIAALLLAIVLPCAQAEEAPVYTCGDFTYIVMEDGTAGITGYTGQEHALQIPDTLDGRTVSQLCVRALYDNKISALYIPGCVKRICSLALPQSVISVSIGENIAYVDYETTLTEQELLSYLAIGMGAPDQGYGAGTVQESFDSPYQPVLAIRNPVEITKQSRGTTVTTQNFPCRLDSFLSQGFYFTTVQQKELDKMLAWEQETGRQLLAPLSTDIKQSDANIWYNAQKKGYINASYSPDLTLYPLNETDSNGEYVRWRETSNGYQVRILTAVYYAYRNGFDPVYPTTDNPIFTPSTAAPDKDGLILMQDSIYALYLTAFSLPEHVQSEAPADGMAISSGNNMHAFVPYGSSAEVEVYFGNSNIREYYPDVPAVSEEVVSGCFSYALLSDGTAKITYCSDNNATVLDIPETLDGYRVTAVSPKALRDCSKLTEITLPSGVTEFGGAQLLDLLELTAVHVAEDNPVLCDVDGVLIDQTTATLLFCPKLYSAAVYTVPSFIRSIGGGAFREGNSVEIILPDGLEKVGPLAFYWQASLTGLYFPDTVTEIGEAAINFNDSLVSVRFPEGLTFISAYNVVSCRSLSEIVFPVGLQEIKHHSFKGCSRLTSIDHLPRSLRTIGDYVFSGNGGLTSISLPYGVVTIGDYAFMNCYFLESLSLPASIETIGKRAFSECYMSSVVFRSGSGGLLGLFCKGLLDAENGTSIGEGAFLNCQRLSSVKLSSSITFIDFGAFDRTRLEPNTKETTFAVEPGTYAYDWCVHSYKVYIRLE